MTEEALSPILEEKSEKRKKNDRKKRMSREGGCFNIVLNRKSKRKKDNKNKICKMV